MSVEAFLVLTRAFAEPFLLASPAGRLLGANPPAARLLGLGGLVPPGETHLRDHVEEPEEEVARFLRRAASSGTFVPAAFTLKGGAEHGSGRGTDGGSGGGTEGGGGSRYRWEGAGLRPEAGTSPGAILLRLRPHVAAAERFLLLNRKIEELAREVHVRRRTEDTLHEQAAELEAMNAELEEAVHELERGREETLQARAEAERASRAKSEFLGVMSHELRTPLNAILGYADLLAAEVQGTLNPEQHQQLERIRRSGRHLITLIEEVLTFSRLDAGSETVHLEEVDLGSIVEEVVEMMGPLAREKELEMRAVVAERVPSVWTDGSKVRQILMNLLSNGVKFTREGTVGVRLGADGEWASLEVFDTGPGIDPRVRKRIFQPFEQGDPFTIRSAGGTGLGLAVSRELARLLDGELVLANGDGPGSTFRLTIPLGSARPV